MSGKFKIFTHRNSENLHIKLMGDFDGSSAYELINVLEKNNSAKKIIIHTGCLEHVFPFGRDVFNENLGRLNGDAPNIMFTGENSIHFAVGE